MTKELLCKIIGHKKTITRSFADLNYNDNIVGEIRMCERCNNFYFLTTHPENYRIQP